VNLSEHGLIEISGTDSKSFLQGLITNNMQLLDEPGKCIAAAFLSPKGRCIADSIIMANSSHRLASTADQLRFVLSCDGKQKSTLIRHLQMYKLRKDVRIEDCSKNYQITSIYPDLKTLFLADESSIQKSIFSLLQRDLPEAIITTDPRTPHLGFRVLLQADTGSIPSGATEISIGSIDEYNCLRMALCVPEGMELVGQIPLEANLEMLNFISFSKGCYIGQELTARSHFKGVVRKRLFPFFLSPQKGASFTTPIARFKDFFKDPDLLLGSRNSVKGISSGSSIFNSKSGKVIGEVLACKDGFGIAQFRIDQLFENDAELSLTVLDSGVSLFPFQQIWFPDLDPETGKQQTAQLV